MRKNGFYKILTGFSLCVSMILETACYAESRTEFAKKPVSRTDFSNPAVNRLGDTYYLRNTKHAFLSGFANNDNSTVRPK